MFLIICSILYKVVLFNVKKNFNRCVYENIFKKKEEIFIVYIKELFYVFNYLIWMSWMFIKEWNVIMIIIFKNKYLGLSRLF